MRLVVVLLALYAFCGVNADGVRAPASTVTCTGSGDPHYVTFDKVRHSLQMSGVFTIAHNDYFTVQAQMMSCHEADSFRTNVVKCIRSVSVTYNLQALDPLSKKYAQWAELTNIGEIYDDNNVNVVTIKWGGWYVFNASARVQNQNTRAWDDVITETNFDESTRKRTPWASFTRTTLGYFNFSSQWFKDNIVNGGNPFVPGMVFARKSGNSLMLTLNPEYISTMIKLWYGGKLPMMMTDEEFSHMYEMPSVTIGYQSFSVVMPEVKSMLFTNGLCGCYDKNGTSEFMGAHDYCNLARNYIRGTRPGVEYGGTPLYQWGPLWFVNATKTDFNGTPDLHSRLKMLKEKQRTAKNGHLYHTRNLINEPAIQGEWENEQVHTSRKLHAARHDAATTPVDDGTQLIVPTEAQIAQFENINIQALPNLEQLTTDCMNLATDAAAGDAIFHEHITKACLVDRALVPDRPDLAATNGEVVVSALQTQAYMRATYLGLNSEGEPDITNSHVQGMIAGVGGFVVAAAVLAALFVYRKKVAKTAARYAAAAQTPAAAEETSAAAPSASASAADEQPRTAAEESI